MIDFDFQGYCSGCGACSNSCPVNAITMISDSKGFSIPNVDNGRCINCGKCDKVCPHINSSKYKKDKAECTWLFSSKNDEAKKRSTSGAAFYELAEGMISDGGYVCGCAWNSDLVATHIIGNTHMDILRMQGSKYVQSDIGECYRKIVELLKDGKEVLFSGTPCQAVAIHSIVSDYKNGKYRNHLTTVAVICHGVSTPKIWESFKKWSYNKKGSKIIDVNFRDKSKEGYKKSYCRYEYESGKVEFMPTYLPTSKYMEATIVYNLAMRNSCTHCDCKGITEGCDIVIGDWYAEYKGDGKLGTSCVVAFTKRGKAIATKYLENLREFKYETILQENSFIEKSEKKSLNRDKFLDDLCDSIWDDVEKYYPPKYKYKKFLVKIGLYDWIKRLL